MVGLYAGGCRAEREASLDRVPGSSVAMADIQASSRAELGVRLRVGETL